jgi:hypothetical protein
MVLLPQTEQNISDTESVSILDYITQLGLLHQVNRQSWQIFICKRQRDDNQIQIYLKNIILMTSNTLLTTW